MAKSKLITRTGPKLRGKAVNPTRLALKRKTTNEKIPWKDAPDNSEKANTGHPVRHHPRMNRRGKCNVKSVGRTPHTVIIEGKRHRIEAPAAMVRAAVRKHLRKRRLPAAKVKGVSNHRERVLRATQKRRKAASKRRAANGS